MGDDETFAEMMRAEWGDALDEHGPGLIPFMSGYLFGFFIGAFFAALVVWLLMR